MKRTFLISFLFGLGIIIAYPQDTIVAIPDTAFLYALIDVDVDTNGDSLISYKEAEAVLVLDVSGEWDDTVNITDMTGIEAFQNLEFLECGRNPFISINVTKNTALKHLDVSGYCSFPGCWDGKLTSLDVSKNVMLKELHCGGNEFVSLELSNNPALIYLDCNNNNLGTLELANNPDLETLYCFGNQLSSLDISKNPALKNLSCALNQIAILDVTKNRKLTTLYCFNNEIVALDVSGNIELINLNCSQNFISRLDVSNNRELFNFYCGGNQLSSLDISNNTEIRNFDINEMTSLHEVCVWTLPFPPSGINMDSTGSPNAYFTTECLFDSIVFIPDTAFLYALIDEGVDTNNDSLISYLEAEAVVLLGVNGSAQNRGYITDMTGIEAFTNIQDLHCENNLLTGLDISNNTWLVDLYCFNNDLTSLDVSNNTELSMLYCIDNEITKIDGLHNTKITELWCGENQIKNLDVSNLKYLKGLDCSNNQLTSLNVLNDTALQWLNCNNNFLTDLDVSTNTNLTLWGWLGHWHGPGLGCANNQLRNLDISKNTKLVSLGCGGNPLTSLDISNNPDLVELYCAENPLSAIDISNNKKLTNVHLIAMPSLGEICVWWDTSTPPDSIYIDTTGSPGVCFQTDCNGDCINVGIDESHQEAFYIYPNPTNSLLIIETKQLGFQAIQITSLNGQLLLSEEIKGNTHQLDLSSFHKGVYLITIRSKDFVTTRKIVKL